MDRLVGEDTMVRRAVTRPSTAALIVLAVYAVLALLNSTGGYLGTDTGAKVITLDRMAEDQTLSPAVGYWAEQWDPEGTYHPLFDTVKNDDGEWINVTTLPMLVASAPLYELGGYRLALLLPMLGALLAAFACRDIARQLADERSGWVVFWVVALASPVTIYALDFWEHAPGAGLMVTAIALLLRVERGSESTLAPLVAGLAFGASATMRTETFVVAFVAVAATCTALLVRRHIRRVLSVGVLCIVGFAGPWLLNAGLEEALGGNRRASRVGGQAQREWWTELGVRAKEALVTWFGLPGGSYPGNVILGAAVVAGILLAGGLLRRGQRRAGSLALGAAALVYLLSFASGFGFVSGALVASPFAVAVLFLRWGRDRAYVVMVALVTTILTWLFQLTGGAGPQWGGRYLLVPTLLLTTLGVVAAVRSRADGLLTAAVGAFAVAVTIFGVAWLNYRSHGVDDFFTDLAERPEDVIISANGFLVREAGPAYDDRRYLSVGRRGDLDGAVDVVEAAGMDDFAVLTTKAAAPELSARFVDSDPVDFLGVQLWYHRYQRSSGSPTGG